ncbi:MAG: MoxR family ATPase [Deltaproteobacteria bacterium]|nr:MoxR family ATPase [Deltaproteobacteria bacterium]
MTSASLSPSDPQPSDRELVDALHQAHRRIQDEIGKRVIGQKAVIDHLLITLFARGHGLFVGVPGLAKTLLINTLADVLALAFNRVQFTPDLMPSDVTGSDILDTEADGRRGFRFVRGPVFCNILLADEINRTPPKTQAALLQSMQEQKVTAGGRTFALEPPFHVFATQNPIEQEGTYPLPEAQLDRFMMMLKVGYPDVHEEAEIVRRTTSAALPAVAKILSPREILAFQDLVLRVPVAAPVVDLAVRICRLTRPADDAAPTEVKEFVSYGAGPRATQHLVMAAKARAILDGRPVVDGSDVQALAMPVLRHRILMNFHAEARKVTADDLLEAVLKAARR